MTSLMVEYLSDLIHHLLKAGEITLNHGSSSLYINLIVFHVYDLMRAEFKCSESIFITLIHRLYLLDESDPAFLIVSKIKKLPSKLSYNMRSKLRTKTLCLICFENDDNRHLFLEVRL